LLLAFKHAYDMEFWRENFREVFIFVGGKLPSELAEGILSATWLYFNSTTKFEEDEMAHLIETLPPPEGEKFKSTFERLIEAGEKRGLEKGRQEGVQQGLQQGVQQGLQQGLKQGVQQGLQQTLLTFLKKFPDWTDEQVASTFEVSLDFVRQVREKI
jgi:Flagellar biosynthesis/type III secretory pathway protein